jgi:DNA-binding CsgD family transcriptional regulator
MNKQNRLLITSREQEVLQLISLEYTLKEIAALLFISPYTVIDHRNSLCRKLGAKKIAGLIRKGFEMGVLQISTSQHVSS